METQGTIDTADPTYDPTPSTRVVLKVADALGIDPIEVDVLNDVVDPDALDRLAGDARGAGNPEVLLSFTLSGCSVIVDGAGDIDVTPPAGMGGESPADASAGSASERATFTD